MADSVKYLDSKELAAFFKAIKDPRDRAIFTIIYFRGLRASEPGLIELQDWSQEKQRIRFRRLKGSIGGEWPLHPRETTALKVWVKVRGKAPGPLFLSRNHRAIGRFQILRLMKEYCALAGIPPGKAHTHALKHSIVMTLLADQKKDLKFIQDYVGHKNMNSTAQYLHLSNERRDVEAKEMYEGMA